MLRAQEGGWSDIFGCNCGQEGHGSPCRTVCGDLRSVFRAWMRTAVGAEVPHQRTTEGLDQAENRGWVTPWRAR